MDEFYIESLSNVLYEIYRNISGLEINSTNPELLKYLKVEKTLALLIASQIDVSICYKHIIDTNISKYEGKFFLNIAFMKMYEITKLISKIVTDSNNILYFEPSESTCKNIKLELFSWRKKYNERIRPIRNNSTAHYDKDFERYMYYGYSEIDKDFNKQCFSDFFALIINLIKYITSEEKQLFL